jgi:hypothetical protein
MHLSGFFFLFIIVTSVVGRILGYKLDEYDGDAKLRKIVDAPQKFRISIVLLLLEHASIVALGISLFVAFGSYDAALGILWVVVRTGEGLLQFYSEIGYWGLLRLARLYSAGDDVERRTLTEAGRAVLETKNLRFNQAMVLFGVGTLAYSIVFVGYDVVPVLLGWMGIFVGGLDALGSGLRLARPKIVAPAYLGGALTLAFEAIIGVWLLVASPIVP